MWKKVSASCARQSYCVAMTLCDGSVDLQSHCSEITDTQRSFPELGFIHSAAKLIHAWDFLLNFNAIINSVLAQHGALSLWNKKIIFHFKRCTTIIHILMLFHWIIVHTSIESRYEILTLNVGTFSR